MGIGAAIASAASWLGASAATAATIGSVGAGALGVGGAVMGAKALKDMSKKADTGGGSVDTSVVGGATPATTQKEEDVEIGSGRETSKGRSKGRRSLMAPQSSAPSTAPASSGAQGLRV